MLFVETDLCCRERISVDRVPVTGSGYTIRYRQFLRIYTARSPICRQQFQGVACGYWIGDIALDYRPSRPSF